jgi:isopropylmalate/homocitrate/citramalate synthase
MSLLILDTTLREGEQVASVSLTQEQKLSLAYMLSDFGVDFIEISPLVSAAQQEVARQMNSAGIKPAVVSHVRAKEGDIDLALKCDSSWVGLFLSTSQIQLESKLRISEEEAVSRATGAISYAKEHGLKVRFTCEDASRTSPDFLKRMCAAAESAKADRISIPDTVGAMNPQGMGELIKEVRSAVSTPLDVHCHNDLGLALANSLAAFEAGATCIHTSINGVGERTGIVRLAELVIAAELLYGEKPRVKKEMLTSLSRTFSEYTNTPESPYMPIVGANAFRHKGGTHLSAVLRNEGTYEIIPPESVGNRRSFVLGEYSGRGMMKHLSDSLGMNLSEEQLEREMRKIKRKKGDLLEFGD